MAHYKASYSMSESSQFAQESGPLSIYNTEVGDGTLSSDPAQAQLMQRFQRLYLELVSAPTHIPLRPASLFQRFLGRGPKSAKIAPPQGIYVWGGVGRGKTHLTDLFFESLPIEKKLRLHYHRFMQRVHLQLKALGEIEDPLERVADALARDARVICLDEMHINDITDAMLMHGLLRGLFNRGVALVTTSNVAPDGLYRDGLQRERFLAAISLMQENCEVFELVSETDYRLRTLSKAKIYHTPIDEQGEQQLAMNFKRLAPASELSVSQLEINERVLNVNAQGEGVVWFSFSELCEGPRAKDDYIELAREFHTVLLSGVPRFGSDDGDVARRFVNLIDEFYDRNVKMVLTAANEPDSLYNGKKLAFEFERTASRLQEMRSHAYLAQPHQP